MQRIIELLERVNRPGTDNLIKYLRESNFATARCYSHHTGRGGLVSHSLEVYENMRRNNNNIPEESTIICALLHDLGKAKLRGWEFEGYHPARAIAILERCGYELSKDEAFAIRYHHRKSVDAITHPYRSAVTKADMMSAAAWKKAHRKPRKSDAIYEMFAKML
jgi:HD superfamily phosphodiesterase